MASLTAEQARDYILAKFKAAWDANSPAVNDGAAPPVEYPNMPQQPHLADGLVPWARVYVRHTSSDQSSLGAVGQRRFTRYGIVTVQVFVPAGKQGLVRADRLGKVALDAFEGEETSTGDVWFRSALCREVGVVDDWYQMNVTAEFTYDFVK